MRRGNGHDFMYKREILTYKKANGRGNGVKLYKKCKICLNLNSKHLTMAASYYMLLLNIINQRAFIRALLNIYDKAFYENS